MSYRPSYLVGDVLNPLIATPDAPAAGYLKVYGKTGTEKLAIRGAAGGEQLLATEAFVGSILGNADALTYKGAIDATLNPDYPAANAGDVWIISVAGKIGGASGLAVRPGDLLLCKADSTATGNQATVGTFWNVVVGKFGAMQGPTSSFDGDFVTFDGITGALVKDTYSHTSTVNVSSTSTQIPDAAAVWSAISGLSADSYTIKVSSGDTGAQYLEDTIQGTLNNITVTTLGITGSDQILAIDIGVKVVTTDAVQTLSNKVVLSPIVTKYFANSPYTVAATDEIILADATSGNMVINLPDVTVSVGRTITIHKTDATANTVTVDGYSTNTINEQLTKVIMYLHDSFTFVTDGGQWYIV